MATSTKAITLDEFYQVYLNEKVEPWTPADLQIDPNREESLMDKMKKSINELESSQFYHNFRDEVQSSPISKHIQRLLGLGSKMKMVIYGIGRIEFDVEAKLQFSLAMLMKKDFNWIGDIEVFDPILSTTEVRVLKSFGCSVLFSNEYGRRQAMEPTMFFMPHCEALLYNNLLRANWKPNLLHNVIIFGNSFDGYINHTPEFSKEFPSNDPRKRNLDIWLYIGHMLAAQTFTNELKMRTITYHPDDLNIDAILRRDCEVSLFRLSWHFFNPITETRMQFIREKTRMQLMREAYGAFMRLKDFWGLPWVKLGEGGRLVILPYKKEHLAIRSPSRKEECSYAHLKARTSAHTSPHYIDIPMAVGLLTSVVCFSTKLKRPNPFR